MTPLARFASYVEQADSGCWLWKNRLSRGYGQFWIGRRRFQAHVWAWQQINGAVPGGLCLDHLCRSRNCVNPAHLEPVTLRENLLRGETHAARNAAKTHCVNGHELIAGNLVSRADGARACLACHRERQARYHAKNPERHREAVRRHRAKRREELNPDHGE